MSQDEFPDDTALGTASPRAFKTAHAWLENCQRHHSLCGKEETTVPVLPTRVIDVGDDSTEPHLHIGNGERAPYLALSYCQDSSSDTITTIGTLQAHMDSIILSSLPLTLREAILATRELGFRFLWVDVLCIIQDNTSDRERETQQMTAIYANAILTLSAHDSGDLQGGLYRPRKDRITSPVQISLRAPKRYQAERLPHQRSYYVLPVHGEKELFSPGPVDTQAWTLQQQLLSTRILHWGPGILFWECLSSHGSESDPEGHTHPYNSSCTNFMDVRHRKRIVQGRAEISDLSYHKWTSDDGQVCEPDDSDEESESPVEEIEELIASRQLPLLDEENPSLEAEAKGADESDIEDEDPETNEEPDLKKITYLEWQKLVSQYSALALPKPTDKIPAFLGLSEIMARTLEDEFVIGVWKKSHFLPSLLWAVTKPGGRSRNENYPSWTWASVDGKVHYPVDPSRIKWEPSMATLDVQVPSAAQDHGTGSIVLRSTMRKFPKEFKFWRYENFLLNPLMTYAFGRSNEWRTKSSKELQEQLLVVEGSRDLRASSGGWEGAGNEIYCLVIARIGATPPPNVGHPAFLGGRPKSLVCLVSHPCATRRRTA
ncbi:hypothetical protein RRF57_011109 [Xylaria bambusicola]|uniref:Heterokaryon incompatibility domain-containing protein n=1 Tax=Xylaria bambusicola TaxID=326684 RepID=A0AAN7UTC7_9PEZI